MEDEIQNCFPTVMFRGTPCIMIKILKFVGKIPFTDYFYEEIF